MQKLVAKEITKSFKERKVVKGIDFEVRSEEIVGLLGPNGAGKTTSFHIIAGLIKPEAGSIWLNGENITELPMYQRARKGISYLPQEPSVFRKLTVEENFLAILETLDLTKDERKGRLEILLEELKIEHLRKNRAYSLSGGERRRVEIGRALITSPLFMLLDEPFAGIDPISVVDLQNIILQLKSKGIGIILTDHSVREALMVCDKAYIINEGEILEKGDPETIVVSDAARKIYFGEKFRL